MAAENDMAETDCVAGQIGFRSQAGRSGAGRSGRAWYADGGDKGAAEPMA
jgi:hypothetical protein